MQNYLCSYLYEGQKISLFNFSPYIYLMRVKQHGVVEMDWL